MPSGPRENVGFTGFTAFDTSLSETLSENLLYDENI